MLAEGEAGALSTRSSGVGGRSLSTKGRMELGISESRVLECVVVSFRLTDGGDGTAEIPPRFASATRRKNRV